MPTVRPDVAAMLAMLNAQPGPQLHEMDPATGRQMMLAMNAIAERPRGDLAEVRDITIPGNHGHAIPARLYRAALGAAAAPVLLYFHGGGWVIGDLETHDGLCAEIARTLAMTVVAVDYRLAPEHPFPAAAEDAIAAARWLAASPAEIGHPVTGIVPAGDSAGGNLAAVVSQNHHAGGGAAPVIAQWLIYPGVDMTAAGGSMAEFGDGHLLTTDAMAWFMNHYLGDADPRHPLASPLHAPDLSNQPPTLVFTCGLDPLRDQGRAYAAALINAGVPTTYREAAGQIHGSATLRQGIPSAHTDLLANLAALRAILDAPA